VSSDATLFREAFRRWATTVVLVTYRDDAGRPAGMTATSMSSLSANPPSLLVCINRKATAHGFITRREAFGVDLLTTHQRSIADHCSLPGRDKHLRDGWLDRSAPADGSPRLRDSIAHLDCVMDTSYEAFSHTIMIGLIKAVWVNPVEGPPLLYHGGIYGRLETEVERTERFRWETGGG
jgi:flavin reductase (DIM6/NTAB) family NADH-FMN oxidoreductase RutF